MVVEILLRKHINPLQEKLFDKELATAAQKLKQAFDPDYNMIQVRARTEEEYKLYLDLCNAFGQNQKRYLELTSPHRVVHFQC